MKSFRRSAVSILLPLFLLILAFEAFAFNLDVFECGLASQSHVKEIFYSVSEGAFVVIRAEGSSGHYRIYSYDLANPVCESLNPASELLSLGSSYFFYDREYDAILAMHKPDGSTGMLSAIAVQNDKYQVKKLGPVYYTDLNGNKKNAFITTASPLVYAQGGIFYLLGSPKIVPGQDDPVDQLLKLDINHLSVGFKKIGNLTSSRVRAVRDYYDSNTNSAVLIGGITKEGTSPSTVMTCQIINATSASCTEKSLLKLPDEGSLSLGLDAFDERKGEYFYFSGSSYSTLYAYSPEKGHRKAGGGNGVHHVVFHPGLGQSGGETVFFMDERRETIGIIKE